MDTTLAGLCGFDIDWRDSKILIMDDGSSDGIEELSDKYGRILNLEIVRIDSLKHPSAEGMTKPVLPVWAINHGVSLANTEYIILSCPEISPMAVNSRDAMQWFINYPLRDKQCLFATVYAAAKNGVIWKISGPTAFWPYFFFGKIRKSDWLGVGGYDEEFLKYVSAADVELHYRMSRNGYTNLFVGQPVMIHRWHETSKFSTDPERLPDILQKMGRDILPLKRLTVENPYVEVGS